MILSNACVNCRFFYHAINCQSLTQTHCTFNEATKTERHKMISTTAAILKQMLGARNIAMKKPYILEAENKRLGAIRENLG